MLPRSIRRERRFQQVLRNENPCNWHGFRAATEKDTFLAAMRRSVTTVIKN
jgi:hypothetical protein